MKKTNKRLVLGKQTVRDLTALDAAQAVGGVTTVNFCPTAQACPTRMCTIFPGGCPM